MTHSRTLRVPLPVDRAFHLFTPVGEPFDPHIAHWEHAIRAALAGS